MTSMCLCLLGGNLVSRQVFVWKGVRGILLDTETAECHRRTDILGEKKRQKKKERKKEKETRLKKCSFLPEKKAIQFWSVKITN